ncbi:MAG TPA: SgcJ/EcaC family oxidoreductase [Vicinamibacterales bacterium]|nr:SgcJ/EcaC family oxidoreductase [Vicinamibacterales bacterium]
MITTLSTIVLLGAFQTPAAPTVPPSQAEVEVRKSVQAFYDAYNAHEFDKLAEFTTEDWTHIAPGGIVRRGRPDVLAALKQVHSTFLKGVTDTPEEIAVRFATADVAVVTVRSRTTTFTTPDGVTHENEGRVRTFVIVKRDNRWLIMQDQNTVRNTQ